MTPHEYLTVVEICEVLKVSKATLARWRRTGRGPPWIRLERGIRYGRMQLDQWIEDNRRK